MIELGPGLRVPRRELEFHAIHARGPGGQNVNKLASAVQLRFDVRRSSLPPELRARLLALPDQRITRDGVIVIRADRFRHQARNREDALDRLRALIARARHRPPARIPTRPGAAARRRRLEAKQKRGHIKRLRGRPSRHDL